MRFSENRTIAWAVLAVVVLLSISLSGGKAMKDMRVEAQQVFFDGAQKDGLSINRDLDVRADKAYQLTSIASKYYGASDRVLVEAQQACQQLTDAKDIPDRHAANTRLTRAVEDLYTELEKANLSEDDKQNAYSAYKEVKSRADTISRDMYNSEARKFNDSISRFPANIISDFTGVDELQLFE